MSIFGDILGPIAGYFGQKETNRENKMMAENQMQFQQDMSNTAYQRAVGDMEKAGLNPMLAYSQGGASSPGGASAQMGNAVASAGELSGAMEQIALTKAAKEKTKMETAATAAALPKIAAEARASNASASAVEYEVANLLGLKQKGMEFDLSGKQADSFAANARFNALGSKVGGAGGVTTLAEDVARHELQRQITEAKLRAYDLPGARNKAASDETAYGKYVRPYITDVNSLSHSAGGLRHFFNAR